MPGPLEPEYEEPDESTVIIPMSDPEAPEAVPTRPASAAPSETASALPGAIDSDGEGESEGEGDGDKEEQEEDNDEEKGRCSDLLFRIIYSEVLQVQLHFLKIYGLVEITS